MAKIICILNAASGLSKDTPDSASLTRLFAEQNLSAEVWQASGSALPELAQKAAQQKPDILVACGGDGTLNCVAAAVLGTEITFAALPLGTFNHFAKDMGLPLKLEEAIAVIAAGHRRKIDVGEVNGRIFLNNSSLGIYPRLVRECEAMQRGGAHKAAAFLRAMMYVAFRYKRLAVRLQTDGSGTVHRTPFIFIGNNSYTAKGWAIGTRQTLEGGKLWLYVARASSLSALIRLAVKALFGDPSAETIEAFETTQCRIETRKEWMHVATDGEITLMQMPLIYKIRPAALTLIAPEAKV